MSRTILLTGATGKLGKVLVGHFLSVGDTVIALGRSAAKLNELSKLFPLWTARLHIFEVDLMSESLVSILNEGLLGEGLEPDCLINNARSLQFLGLDALGMPTNECFLNEFKLGVVVPYQLTMGLAIKRNSRLRSVVNIGSMYGSVAPNPRLYKDAFNQSPIQYGVSKAALEQLTKELAVRLAKNRVRVNCVAFGGVEGRVDEEFKGRYADLCPAGRMLDENEIPGPIDMLLSESASGINGHVLMVDGGWTLW